MSLVTACGPDNSRTRPASSQGPAPVNYQIEWDHLGINPEVIADSLNLDAIDDVNMGPSYPEFDTLAADLAKIGKLGQTSTTTTDETEVLTEVAEVEESSVGEEVKPEPHVAKVCNKAAEKVRYACINTKVATKRSCELFASWTFSGCYEELNFENNREVN